MGRCEAGDKRRESNRRWKRERLASLLAFSSRFSEAFLHFTRGRAGSWRLLRDLLGNLCLDGAQSRHPLAPPASSYYRFTTSPFTCANFRMRVSARQLSNPATPFFVASCTIDAIGKIVGFALNTMIYYRKDRAPSPSLKAKAQHKTMRYLRARDIKGTSTELKNGE